MTSCQRKIALIPLSIYTTSASIRRMWVAFCAAMPRCLSRSRGSSLTGCARVNALRIGKIDRADGNHLHR
jgi:hypothetical protein